jgi:hypothetical protein
VSLEGKVGELERVVVERESEKVEDPGGKIYARVP